MRSATIRMAIIAMPAFAASLLAQQATTAPMARFAGTWVGAQSWTIAEPPPGSRSDQPVTLLLEVTDGKLTGSMKPFLGGDDGATIVDAQIVGEELHATAVIGRPRAGGARRGAPVDSGAGAGGAAGGRAGPTGNWKDSTAIRFVFRNSGLEMTGTADVRLGEVPWMTYKYQLSKKRARY